MIDYAIVSGVKERAHVSGVPEYVSFSEIWEKGDWGQTFFALFIPVSAISLIFLVYFVALILW